METTYEVLYGMRKGRKFTSLQDAVIFAREAARDMAPRGYVVSIWEDSVVVIAVVTDDANAITVHRLATWPEDVECAYQ